jgi:hypothetical protein
MAVTQDARFGTNRWGAGTDPWPARLGWNALLDLLTTKAAIFAEGTFAARPAFAAAKKGSFYWATDQQRLYYQSATAWTEVSPVGGGGVPKPVAIDGNGKEGASRIAARADHIHPDPDFVALPLSSSVTAYAGLAPSYRIVGNSVDLAGAVRRSGGPFGALGNPTTIANNTQALAPPGDPQRQPMLICAGAQHTATGYNAANPVVVQVRDTSLVVYQLALGSVAPDVAFLYCSWRIT